MEWLIIQKCAQIRHSQYRAVFLWKCLKLFGFKQLDINIWRIRQLSIKPKTTFFAMRVLLLSTFLCIIWLIKSLFNYRFKLVFNEFLDVLKFKTVRKCRANNYNPKSAVFNVPCRKYAYWDYCDEHAYIMRISCAAYHFYSDPCLSHMSKSIIAAVELKSRLQYCQRFSIQSDPGHAAWNEKLERESNVCAYIQDADFYEEERHKFIINRVMHGKIAVDFKKK